MKTTGTDPDPNGERIRKSLQAIIIEERGEADEIPY